MKLYEAKQSRAEDLQAQIERSSAKFKYCRVSTNDVRKYVDVVTRHRYRRSVRGPIGPILCLGTRNGREVDLFRIQCFGPFWLRWSSSWMERRTQSFTTVFPQLEALGRSDLNALGDASVIGVELNPRAARSDVWTGSFDAMPADWVNRFRIVYSNSFDHSEDCERTAREWRRVIRPGGYLVFSFTHDKNPTLSDRVGGLMLADVRALFQGDLVYFQDRGSSNGYSEVILQC